MWSARGALDGLSMLLRPFIYIASESRPSPPCGTVPHSAMQAVAEAEVAFDVNDCMCKIGNEALDTITDRRPAAEYFGRLARQHGQDP